jgi:16S rRNA (cytosine1402-N4)-methyltransferase
MSHVPVLLNEVLEQLDPHPGDFMIDGTVDGGGHAAAIMERIMPGGRLLGVDWDERLLAGCRERFRGEKEAIFVHGNYADLPEILLKLFEKERFWQGGWIVIDLGFSSEQLEASGRGFSFSEASKDEPLLMTYMIRRAPVAQILRESSEKELADIIYEFGGERDVAPDREGDQGARHGGGRSKRAVNSRKLSGGRFPKGYEHGRIDPATRTFQALRIYANDELKNLKKCLTACLRS